MLFVDDVGDLGDANFALLAYSTGNVLGKLGIGESMSLNIHQSEMDSEIGLLGLFGGRK